mmetsp:Transcript_66681/g.134413  ORF Transcript_66681/g.134413 Transcript_66681/m.134413 type:complete len:444 (+) Transcript_66681:131-1462(+)
MFGGFGGFGSGFDDGTGEVGDVDVSTWVPAVRGTPGDCRPFPGEHWGLPTNDDVMARAMLNNPSCFEKRHANACAVKKVAALEAARSADPGAAQRDVTLRVELVSFRGSPYCAGSKGEPMDPPVWRRVRCSGGATLGMLLDRLVLPAMGWVRNYHLALLYDVRDGAVFGQKESSSIDRMHLSIHGVHHYAPDTSALVGDLLDVVGECLVLCYDLGDNFEHTITVEEVASEGASTGRMEVLDGANACPPEDSNGLPGKGCHAYQEFLDAAQASSHLGRQYREACAEASGALNYKAERRGFDPRHFSLADRRLAVREAVAGRASEHSGAKVFNHSLQPGGAAAALPGVNFLHRKTEQRATPAGWAGSSAEMVETVRVGKDPRPVGVCVCCGSPHDLKSCSKCHLVRYCGRECQRSDWNAGHKLVCKAKARKKKKEDGGGGGLSVD